MVGFKELRRRKAFTYLEWLQRNIWMHLSSTTCFWENFRRLGLGGVGRAHLSGVDLEVFWLVVLSSHRSNSGKGSSSRLSVAIGDMGRLMF